MWVKNRPPAFDIMTPVKGSTVEGTVKIAANFTDNGYVAVPVTHSIQYSVLDSGSLY